MRPPALRARDGGRNLIQADFGQSLRVGELQDRIVRRSPVERNCTAIQLSFRGASLRFVSAEFPVIQQTSRDTNQEERERMLNTMDCPR